MHSDLVELGWTDDQWNRICSTVAEEAQKARVAAQVLPVVGSVDPTTVAIPTFTLGTKTKNPALTPRRTAPDRMDVDSDPTLFLTQISVNVPLRTREAADPSLEAALVMFRRAANYIARVEDALAFNGRTKDSLPAVGVSGIPAVVQVTGDGTVQGLCPVVGGPPGNRLVINVKALPGKVPGGDKVVTGIIRAINQLDSKGQLGPYACVLSPFLFELICTPNQNLVLPRDRILPFLQGPLLRSSAIFEGPAKPPAATKAWGLVVATSGNPVELVVASDINVRYLQTSEEPRLIFRVSEKVAVRIKEDDAIALLNW